MKLPVLLLCIAALVTYALKPKTLKKLGKKIEEQIENRQGEWSVLKTNLLTYHEHLKDILKLVQQNCSNGDELYALLEDTVGPPFTTIPIYNVLITRAFNCSFQDVEDTEKLIDGSEDLWLEIQSVVTNRTNTNNN